MYYYPAIAMIDRTSITTLQGTLLC